MILTKHLIVFAGVNSVLGLITTSTTLIDPMEVVQICLYKVCSLVKTKIRLEGEGGAKHPPTPLERNKKIATGIGLNEDL